MTVKVSVAWGWVCPASRNHRQAMALDRPAIEAASSRTTPVLISHQNFRRTSYG